MRLDLDDVPRGTARQTAGFVINVRRALTVTQAELAQLVGVQVSAVSLWENAKHRPHPRHWRRLRELLKTATAQ